MFKIIPFEILFLFKELEQIIFSLFCDGPGFQRLCHELNPGFQVASEAYYRSLLDPTFEKLKEKLKDKIKSDNPAISLDGWSDSNYIIEYISK